MSFGRFTGVFPILHTPFFEDLRVDPESLAREVEYCIEAGARGVAFPQLASEYYTLTEAERRDLAEVAIDAAGSRIPVVIGVSTATRPTSAALAEHAAGAGAAGLIALPPFPFQGGTENTIAYFEAISAAAPGLPIVVQNPRQPDGIPLSAQEMHQLLDRVPAAAYLKEEAIPPGARISAALESFGDRVQGVFSGFFGLSHVQDVQRGACGVMPGVTLTRVHARIHELLEAGQDAQALQLQRDIMPLLHYLSLYEMAGEKHLMHRAGVFTATASRAARSAPLTDVQVAEIDALLAVGGLSEMFS